jgi:hypothetical protein
MERWLVDRSRTRRLIAAARLPLVPEKAKLSDNSPVANGIVRSGSL